MGKFENAIHDRSEIKRTAMLAPRHGHAESAKFRIIIIAPTHEGTQLVPHQRRTEIFVPGLGQGKGENMGSAGEQTEWSDELHAEAVA